MLTADWLTDEIATQRKRADRIAGVIARYPELDERKPMWEQIVDPSDFFAITGYVRSAQCKSTDIEYFISRMMGWDEIAASENRGDAKADGRFFELKTSTTNVRYGANFRQIRPWQKVDYYICSYVNEDDLSKSHCWKLTKKQMLSEIAERGTASHGTHDANETNGHVEYSISFQIDSDACDEWDRKYRYDDMYDKLNA